MISSIITILASVFLILCFYLYFFQEKFLYYPDRSISATPSDINLHHEDVYLISNNKKIHGWHIPHPEAKAHVLFLHGNAGNISHRMETIQFLHDLQLSTLIIDYQGYGNSEGKPSEQGSYEDGLVAWNYLTQEKGIDAKDIIVFGRSLGGAIASWIGKEKQPGMVILESTFTSVSDMGKKIYPYLPTRWLTRIHYNNIEHVKQIESPILIVHSQADELIPFEHGQILHDSANEPKSFYEIQGGHNDAFLSSIDDYKKHLAGLIEQHLTD